MEKPAYFLDMERYASYTYLYKHTQIYIDFWVNIDIERTEWNTPKLDSKKIKHSSKIMLYL